MVPLKKKSLKTADIMKILLQLDYIIYTWVKGFKGQYYYQFSIVSTQLHSLSQKNWHTKALSVKFARLVLLEQFL